MTGTAKSKGVGDALAVAALGWRKDIVEVLLASGMVEQRALDHAILSTVVDEEEFEDFGIIDPVPKGSPEGKKLRVAVARALLDAGANINAKDSTDGMAALHKTGRMGSRTREIFELLLQRGADMNAKDVLGRTPLFYAVLGDEATLVEGLVERGASVMVSDEEGYAPLHVSGENLTPACEPIISFLLAKGASPLATSTKTETPLHHACHNGNAVAVKMLLTFDPDLINAKSSNDWRALHFAADIPGPWGCADQCIEVSKILLDYGADINAASDEGFTVLHRAIASQPRDAIDLVAYLLDNGANIDRPGGADSPLHLAVIMGDLDIVDTLLVRGADIEARDSSGRTPLLRAVIVDEVRDWRPDLVVELIKRGADVDARDESGLGFENLAEKKGWEIVRDDENGTRQLRRKGVSNNETGSWGECWMASAPGDTG